MDFFNKLGKKASETCKATTEITGKITKEAKLKMKMNENKADIKELYNAIGKKVYEKHVREENIDISKELEEELTQIDVLSAEIETCLKELLEMKEKKQCLSCHSEIDLTNAFCPNCGAKQDQNAKPQEEEIIEKLENSNIDEANQNEKEIVIDNLQEDINQDENDNSGNEE